MRGKRLTVGSRIFLFRRTYKSISEHRIAIAVSLQLASCSADSVGSGATMSGSPCNAPNLFRRSVNAANANRIVLSITAPVLASILNKGMKPSSFLEFILLSWSTLTAKVQCYFLLRRRASEFSGNVVDNLLQKIRYFTKASCQT